MGRPHAASGVVVVTALAVGLVVPTHAAAVGKPQPADPAKTAARRLAADADGALRIQRSGGRVTFVGAAHGTDVTNPAVRASQSPVAAARAHLQRYGAALGTDAAGTTLVDPAVGSTSTGASVVRLQQDVGGIPVVAGQAAVTMYADRSLSSLQADLSAATSVPPATVGEGQARQTARASAGRAAHATDSGRWLLDPAVIGMPSSRGARGVWRFVVTAASGTSSDVMVDDATGRVLLSVPLEESIDRVVCDRANTAYNPANPDPLCESGYARSEGDPATGSADVDSAYDLAGETSDFYASLGVDLTNLIGRRTTADPGGPKRLESTVRFCYSGTTCPYANAFWDGNGMYYGQGWATADDVVGHEMTHGVTEHTSNLFYWGQSGAINESISDIMGEIVDHRNGTDDDSQWLLGEDSPVGAIRSMKDPTLYNQPDSMTSGAWYQGTSDAGGVHTNSGVGNKTAYLISQGGSFGGQTITGIDGSDPALTKSAYLWLNVDERLISGSDYSDLAAVLDQTCSDLIGQHGFTATDCAAVHQATIATGLRTSPTGVPLPPVDCPNGGVRRDLYDEQTDPAAGHGLSPAGSPTLWHRPTNATGTSPGPSSSLDYWVADDVPTAQTSSLRSNDYADLPSGQSSYLEFRHRFLLDYGGGTYYDGGTVEVNSGASPSALSWTANGPTRSLYGTGLKAFSGDSVGWWTSQLDLTPDAGTWVQPQFTLHTDNDYADGQNTDYSLVGWYVADVAVYTCDTTATNLAPPTISGQQLVGKVLTAHPGSWTRGATFTYQWLRGGQPIAGATSSTYLVRPADYRTHLAVQITASVATIAPGTARSVQTALIGPGTLRAARSRITGIARVGKTLTAVHGTWSPAGVVFSYVWTRGGRAIRGATHRTYRLSRADRGHRIRVVVYGRRYGYSRAASSSPLTAVVR